MSGIQESAPVEATAPAGAEESSTSGRRRRRRRLVIVGTGGAVLVAAVIVIVAVMASDSGSGRSGTLNGAPLVDEFKGCGELGCGTPMFTIKFWVPSGTSAEVNIAAISGCIGFGSQTRTYQLTSSADVYRLSGNWWYFYWKQPVPFTNICLGSWYRARVRVYDGGWSPWSAWVATEATTLDRMFNG